MNDVELAQWLADEIILKPHNTMNDWLLTARELQKKIVDFDTLKNIINSMELLRHSEGDTVAYEGLRDNLLVKMGLLKSHFFRLNNKEASVAPADVKLNAGSTTDKALECKATLYNHTLMSDCKVDNCGANKRVVDQDSASVSQPPEKVVVSPFLSNERKVSPKGVCHNPCECICEPCNNGEHEHCEYDSVLLFPKGGVKR